MEMLKRLSHAAVDTPQTIKWCWADSDVVAFLQAAGLVQGAAVRVISSCAGNVIVAVNQKRIALSAEIAGQITV